MRFFGFVFPFFFFKKEGTNFHDHLIRIEVFSTTVMGVLFCQETCFEMVLAVLHIFTFFLGQA